MTNLPGVRAFPIRSVCASVLLAVAGLASPAVFAQGDVPPAKGTAKAGDKAGDKQATNSELLEDFLHYTTIRSLDAAQAVGQELLGRKVKPADFATLVESGDTARFDQKIQQALRISTLEPTAGALLKLYETGKLQRARDPGEVTKNIALLSGNDRGRLLARQRLVQAGEYAVPQMLEAMLTGKDAQKGFYLQQALVAMGRQAIAPLCTALTAVPADQQEKIVGVLGQIPYRTSVPYIADVAASASVASLKSACDAALQRLGGVSMDVASMYRQLAEEYYSARTDVTSFPGEEFQLLWTYKPQAGGLVMQEIKSPVFHEAMAMRLAERAMTLESSTGGVTAGTLALWVASNFSREIDTPTGYVNPAYPTAGAAPAGVDPRRGAMYFGVASGAEIAQMVLARAIDSKHTPLARMALEAVEKTGGRQSLVKTGVGSRSPLLEAITYPNRRVQFEAALAVAASQPTEGFVGADRVVPTLASAVHGADERFAAVVTDQVESYQQMRRALEAGGFKVLPQGRTFSDLAGAIAEATSVDLVVSAGVNSDRLPALITDVRANPRTAATPVLSIANQETYIEMGRRYESDFTVAIRPAGTGAAELAASVSQLMQAASGGPISTDEASAYSRRSISALRDLAVSGNSVLKVSDATTMLVADLGSTSGATRLAVADVLARIGVDRAQRAVADAALTASGAERIELLNLVSSSAKRFGGMLEQRQVDRVVELAGKGADAEATAAAGLMGALSLPNSQVLPLIIKK